MPEDTTTAPDARAACVLINAAWQIVRRHIGRTLPGRDAERVRVKLKEARHLLTGKPPRLRGPLRAVVRRDGGNCRLCGRPLGYDYTLDHVVPRSRGGTHERENLKAAHSRCNSIKGNRLMSELDPREFAA